MSSCNFLKFLDLLKTGLLFVDPQPNSAEQLPRNWIKNMKSANFEKRRNYLYLFVTCFSPCVQDLRGLTVRLRWMSVSAPPVWTRVNAWTRSAALSASAQQVGKHVVVFMCFYWWISIPHMWNPTCSVSVFRLQRWNVPHRHRRVFQYTLFKWGQMYRPTQRIWLWMCWR